MRMMKTHAILAVWVSCAAWCCAQTNDAPSQTARPIELTRSREWFLMGGGKYDSVTGPTASGCVCWQIDHPRRRTCSHDFWILQAEAGRDGGKLQFGIGSWYMVGAAAKLSLLRTWGDPERAAEGQTYVGVECQGNIFLLNATVGLYTRLCGAGADETLVTWSAGIGF